MKKCMWILNRLQRCELDWSDSRQGQIAGFFVNRVKNLLILQKQGIPEWETRRSLSLLIRWITINCYKKTFHHDVSFANLSPEKIPRYIPWGLERREIFILDQLRNWTAPGRLPHCGVFYPRRKFLTISKDERHIVVVTRGFERVIHPVGHQTNGLHKVMRGRCPGAVLRARRSVRNSEGGTVGDSKQKQVYHPHQHIQRARAEYQQLLVCVENCKRKESLRHFYKLSDMEKY
jgi:hypothetical protein